MSRINRVSNMFDVLEKLSAKYPDYKPVASTQIVYHDPETPEQEEKAKKIAKGSLGLYYIASIAFVITFIASIFAATEIWVVFLLFVLCVLIVGLTIKNRFQKVQVITGKAVYKDRDTVDGSMHRYTYHISVIPDGGEKVIYTKIQVSEQDYQQITEGTPVMIVNKGPKACIL